MMAEWGLKGDKKGGFQSHLVTIQSAEKQAHFSDFSVEGYFRNKITPNTARTQK